MSRQGSPKGYSHTLLLAAAMAFDPIAAEASSNDYPPDQVDAGVLYSKTLWTAHHGLPGTEIHDIVQDSGGFIWLATNDGASRFDGLQFDTYRSPEGSNIRTIAEELPGRYWLARSNGLSVSDGASLTDWRYGLPQTDVRALLHSGLNKCLWIGTTNGLFRLSYGSGEMRHSLRQLSDSYIESLAEDSLGRLWIGHRLGLQRFDPDSEHLSDTIRPIGENRMGAAGDPYRKALGSIYVDPDDTVYALFGSWPTPSYCLFKVVGHSIQRFHRRFLDPGHQIAPTHPPRAGELFMLASNAWCHMPDPSPYGVTYRDPDFLHGDYFTAMLADSENNIWVAAMDRGLLCFRPNYLLPPAGEHEPSVQSSWSTLWDVDDSLVVASDNGLFTYSEASAENLSPDDERDKTKNRSVIRDDQGRLWRGTTKGLFVQTKVGWSSVPLPKALRGEAVTALMKGHDDQIWAGTPEGLAVLDSSSNSAPARLLLEGVPIIEIHTLPDGSSLVATVGKGLTRIVRHESDEYQLDWIPSPTTVSAVAVLEPNRYLVGSPVGIGVVDNNAFIPLNVSPLPTGSTISDLLVASSGHVWGILERDVIRWNLEEVNTALVSPQTMIRAIRYPAPFDNPSLAFNGGNSHPGVSMDSRECQLAIPTNQGVKTLRFDRIPEALPKPQPKFRSLTATGSRILVHQVGPKASIHIPPGGGQLLTIEFTALYYRAPHIPEFRYRLATGRPGDEPLWIESATSRKAAFLDLAPKHYRFQLQSRIPGGEWPEDFVELSFVIAPSLIQRAEFQICLGTLLVVLAIVSIASGMKKLRVEHALAMEATLHDERDRVSKNIHDDIGASLTALRLHLELMQRHTSRRIPEQSHFQRLYRCIDDAASMMRHVIWTTSPSKANCHQFISYLVAYAENYLSPLRIHVACTLSNLCSSRSLESIVRENLLKSVKEVLTNVVRHSKATTVAFTLAQMSPTQCTLTIRDNGRGFATDEKDAGEGLRIIQERMQRIGGNAILESNPGHGTTVSLTFPSLASEKSLNPPNRHAAI